MSTTKDFLNNPKLGRAKKIASKIIDNPAKIKDLGNKASEYLDKFSAAGSKQALVSKFKLLIRMVGNWRQGKYPVSTKIILAVVGGLIYFVMPIDAIPDFIPVAGWLDDIVVLRYLYTTFEGEISKYKEWELAQMTITPTAPEI